MFTHYIDLVAKSTSPIIFRLNQEGYLFLVVMFLVFLGTLILMNIISFVLTLILKAINIIL
jgi:hypothetical protein